MDRDGPMKLEERVEKYGLCNDMCPEFERVRRIVEMDYKAAECTPETARLRRNDRVPDESRMIKAHTRSAAGQDNELISEVRTPEACLVSTPVLCSVRDSYHSEDLETHVASSGRGGF